MIFIGNLTKEIKLDAFVMEMQKVKLPLGKAPMNAEDYMTTTRRSKQLEDCAIALRKFQIEYLLLEKITNEEAASGQGNNHD